MTEEQKAKIEAAIANGDEEFLGEFRAGHFDAINKQEARENPSEAYSDGYDVGSQSSDEESNASPGGLVNKVFYQPSPLGSKMAVILYDKDGNRSEALITMEEAAMHNMMIQSWFTLLLQAQMEQAFGQARQANNQTESGIVIPGR
jgi:hypothetical protein